MDRVGISESTLLRCQRKGLIRVAKMENGKKLFRNEDVENLRKVYRNLDGQ
ncbi:MerR family transcriptional regulator [Olivibacter sitiensis]|uniref:MerR family transcriptional regulator n=1 Tax=Olivibacter sitiensis TaxID=376470 RepID=UPI00040FC5F4|nr:MerR family transcriptional regulator [Olivibacter sitiensis]